MYVLDNSQLQQYVVMPNQQQEKAVEVHKVNLIFKSRTEQEERITEIRYGNIPTGNKYENYTAKGILLKNGIREVQKKY